MQPLTDTKQRLVANAMLLIPYDAIFIQTNMKKRLKIFLKFYAGKQNNACGDDKLMFFQEPNIDCCIRHDILCYIDPFHCFCLHSMRALTTRQKRPPSTKLIKAKISIRASSCFACQYARACCL